MKAFVEVESNWDTSKHPQTTGSRDDILVDLLLCCMYIRFESTKQVVFSKQFTNAFWDSCKNMKVYLKKNSFRSDTVNFKTVKFFLPVKKDSFFDEFCWKKNVPSEWKKCITHFRQSNFKTALKPFWNDFASNIFSKSFHTQKKHRMKTMWTKNLASKSQRRGA